MGLYIGNIKIPELRMNIAVTGDSSNSGGSSEEWIGDGNTHIWIHLEEGRTSPMLGVCPNGTVTVDWGDGTTPDVLTGTSVTSVKWTPTHNYEASGDYIITLTVDGEMGLFGTSGNREGGGILRKSPTSDYLNYPYRNSVQKVELGRSVTTIAIYAFYYCCNLKNIYIPDSVTNIGLSAFSNCYNLEGVSMRACINTINSNMFYDCHTLSNIGIPNGVIDVNNNVFYRCYNLTNVDIPNSVTYIGGNVFYECYSIKKIRFNGTNPPSVSSSSVLTSLPTDCIISVPTGSLAAYTSATNYPSASKYTYIEEG